MRCSRAVDIAGSFCQLSFEKSYASTVARALPPLAPPIAKSRFPVTTAASAPRGVCIGRSFFHLSVFGL